MRRRALLPALAAFGGIALAAPGRGEAPVAPVPLVVGQVPVSGDLLPEAVATHLGGASKAHAPVEAWIEYYRSLYRYFRKHSPPWTYRFLRAGRFAKIFLNTGGTFLVLMLSMGLNARALRKFPVYMRLLLWLLALCPEGPGLKKS